MDLSFLDSVKPEGTNLTVLMIVGVSICLVSLVLHIIFGKQYAFWCIVFSLTSGSLALYGIYSTVKQSTETQFKKYEELSEAVERTYGIEISDHDLANIVEKYSGGSDIKDYRKAVVNEQDENENKVIYYTLDKSELNFYEDSGNNNFSIIKP